MLAVHLYVVFSLVKLDAALTLPFPFLENRLDFIAEFSQLFGRQWLPILRGCGACIGDLLNLRSQVAKIGGLRLIATRSLERNPSRDELI
ncbi:hypothetical protein UB31_18305 [Bradyrhizobium sp. LTSP849]|nr:hypothetical protein UB31_18305 [Bradyrhizobium sp. LTSP849]